MNRRDLLAIGSFMLPVPVRHGFWIEEDHTLLDKHLHHVLNVIAALKPGMKLEDVLRIASTEMGLQDPFEPVFELDSCHYIKFRVRFAAAVWKVPKPKEQNQAKPNPAIVSVSAPYIALPRDIS